MSVPAATAAGQSRTIGAPSSAQAPLRLPVAPRRVSGPTRHPRAASGQPVVASSRWLALIDHPWLDRLIRGRAWIAIVAAALLGIVAVQVVLLRLGAQISAQTTAVNSLIAHNETTSATIAGMEASGGVYGASATAKMVDPPPDDVTYMHADSGDAARAAAIMTSPSAAAIQAEAAARTVTASQTITPAIASPPSTATATTTTTGATAATATTGTTSASGTAAAATGATTAGAPAASGATSTGAPAATGATSTTATAPTAPANTTPPAGRTTAGGTTSSGAAAQSQVPATSQGGAVVAPASQAG